MIDNFHGIWAYRNRDTRDIELLFWRLDRTTDGNVRRYGRILELYTPEPGAHVQPTATIEYEQAQQMMDELWTCGLRPTEGSGSAGCLAATERHLKDMQRLVFEGTLVTMAGDK